MDEGDAGDRQRDARSQDGHIWFVMSPDAVPPAWKERAVAAALVPLTPEESAELMKGGPAYPALTAEEESVARRAARGMSAEEIARELHMTPRSVYRRLARLRERFGVRSSAELASRLAKAGF